MLGRGCAIPSRAVLSARLGDVSHARGRARPREPVPPAARRGASTRLPRAAVGVRPPPRPARHPRPPRGAGARGSGRRPLPRPADQPGPVQLGPRALRRDGGAAGGPAGPAGSSSWAEATAGWPGSSSRSSRGCATSCATSRPPSAIRSEYLTSCSPTAAFRFRHFDTHAEVADELARRRSRSSRRTSSSCSSRSASSCSSTSARCTRCAPSRSRTTSAVDRHTAGCSTPSSGSAGATRDDDVSSAAATIRSRRAWEPSPRATTRSRRPSSRRCTASLGGSAHRVDAAAQRDRVAQ